MFNILAIPGQISLVLFFALLVMKIWALADAAVRPTEAFPAADKQTKVFWLVLLGVAVVLDLVFRGSPLSITGLLGTVAAAVYLAGVRPAVKEASGRGRRSGGNDGPYGPW
ncbi:DUF2516 family protein [Tenggerimyces flavus]|uniref:DUF2516 family protein n=1 Tax=Tenggerimyces flavus TaxID=1708749 RepID=A0ABV7YAV9_9ACTN|nr:DUF2516 family protein [Tenggerimyces flavus]MBM7783797.1 hypothetical protein [Tenggerimyces flavus]